MTLFLVGLIAFLSGLIVGGYYKAKALAVAQQEVATLKAAAVKAIDKL